MRAQVKLRSSVGDALAEVTPGELAARVRAEFERNAQIVKAFNVTFE